MALALSPFRTVLSCPRFERPHVHLVEDTGSDICDSPEFVLAREAFTLTGEGPNPLDEIRQMTLMPSKKQTSDKGSPQDGKAPAKEPAPSKKPEMNDSVTEKAKTVNRAGAKYRGRASLTWNHAVIFPAELVEHLPFKYTNKNDRQYIQVDIVDDTVVLSKWVAPDPAKNTGK